MVATAGVFILGMTPDPSRDYNAALDELISLEGFQLSVGGMGRLPDGTYILDWRNIPPEHRLTGSLQFIFANAQSQRNPRFAVSIAVAYSVGKTEEGSFALDWLQSTAVGKHLVDPKSKTVFLKLKRLSFWKGLSFKDIDNATSYLQQKLDSVKTETVSFFGISVNKTVSVWAAPLTCLSIEWFFLWHFRRFVLHDANETATDYPWIALFPGRLNGITTYSSLALLPVCANSILLFFYGHGGEWATKG